MAASISIDKFNWLKQCEQNGPVIECNMCAVSQNSMVSANLNIFLKFFTAEKGSKCV